MQETAAAMRRVAMQLLIVAVAVAVRVVRIPVETVDQVK
jgi:hypothetical protein